MKPTPCPVCHSFDTRQRPAQTFTIAGVEHTAPAIWIAGRATHYQHTDKLPGLQAYSHACMDWAEQCQLQGETSGRRKSA